MTSLPIACTYDGESFVPLKRFSGLCDKQYVIGETYLLAEHQQRSQATHNHYFACINDAWANLPEVDSERFPTPEHLRRFALIKAGYHDSHTLTCSSKAEALRLAAFIRPVDEYSVVVVRDATVTRYSAKSQSMRAMGKKVFGESKAAVLAALDEMIGVAPGTVESEAGRAA